MFFYLQKLKPSPFEIEMCFIDVPFSWPGYPLLLLVRNNINGKELGFLCDMKRTLKKDGFETTVFTGVQEFSNKEGFLLHEFFNKSIQIKYDNIDEIKKDGWQIANFSTLDN